MRSSLREELKPTGRNKSIRKSTNDRHLIHRVLLLYMLLFHTNIIYDTVWHWRCQNMFTICFMNAGSQVIDAMKYQSLTLKACHGAWHQQTKALISLVFMTGPKVSWHLFNIPSKESLIKKTRDGPKYFHSFWCVLKYHKCLPGLEPFLEIKMTDEQVQKKSVCCRSF